MTIELFAPFNILPQVGVGGDIPNPKYVDGIFYGIAKLLGWENAKLNRDIEGALYYECDSSVKEIAKLLKDNWRLNSLKCIGNMDAKVNKVLVCGHINEGIDIKPLINRINKENINLLLPLELIDFTLTEYIKDSGQLGQDKAILAAGHFNLEEPGMEYMLEYLDDALGDHIDAYFVPVSDMYNYL